MTGRPSGGLPVVRRSALSVRFIIAGSVLSAFLIGAECVRAAVYRADVTGSIAETGSAGSLVAAELDPVFVEKLAQRSRRAYERAHQLRAPTP